MPQTRRRPARAFWLALLLAARAGAQSPEDAYPVTPMATSWVVLHGHRYTVEVARTDAQRARGLMFRDRLPRRHGMLFLHETQRPLAYWMKNTRIALDIFYIDADQRLVSVSKDTPPCALGDACPPYRSDGPAEYVLELNAGVADKLHAKKGDRVEFGPDIAAPPPSSS